MVRPQTPARSLLLKTDHRPWPIPRARWIWSQKWLDAAFLHWSFTPEEVQELLPRGMTLDLWEGRAWISIVAFTMHGVHPQGLWPMPGLSTFAELNIRTYVVHDGKPGVYFLSIEAANPLAAWLARVASPLPYRFKKMQRSRQNGGEIFEAGHPAQDGYLHLHYQVGATLPHKTPLDLWLTERYCLYVDRREQQLRAEVHHEPWPLQTMELLSFQCRYRFSESVYFHAGPDLVHYSAGVPILAWKHEPLVTATVQTPVHKE
ncbi:MAG TPA: DUF2071 domain-containing protein [Oligoflexus sp.]|uniref:YqjF family protein n=1 Tax=Oligoflexus sp. TaxID=1971216 RepID=UPI002D43757C|nr:DUF2071 domain-containing protein [Oligoflexus sp.]HYX32545.1 DUF2071 domain-containing protein [Oligoflexus sp.]